MAIRVSGEAYLYQASGAGAEAKPYLDAVWVYDDDALYSGVVVCSYATAGSLTDYREIAVQNTGESLAREADATNTNTATTSGAARATDDWVMVAASWFNDPATVDRAIYSNGTKATSGAARTPSLALDNTRIGGRADSGSGGNFTLRYIAEISRWNLGVAGAEDALTDGEVDNLVARLYTKVGGAVVDPQIINAEVGEPWHGRLIRYWKCTEAEVTALLADTALIVDQMDSENDFGRVGSPGTATHPTMIDWVAPEITSVTTAPYLDGATITVTGVGFDLLGTGGCTVTVGGDLQTVTSDNNTTVEYTAAINDRLYGVEYALVVTSEQGVVAAGDIYVEYEPASGEAYTDITETPATEGLRISSDLDIAIGSQVHYKNFLNATAVAQAIADVTVQADGSVTINDDEITRPATIEVRVNNNDGEGWSAFETITLDDPAAPVNPELIGTDTIAVEHFLGDTFSITLAQQLSGGTWPWTLEAGGPWPGDFALNAGTGEITGTATPVGAYGPFTVRATGDTVDVDFTVNITVSALPVSPLNTRSHVTIARVGALMSR